MNLLLCVECVWSSSGESMILKMNIIAFLVRSKLWVMLEASCSTRLLLNMAKSRMRRLLAALSLSYVPGGLYLESSFLEVDACMQNLDSYSVIGASILISVLASPRLHVLGKLHHPQPPSNPIPVLNPTLCMFSDPMYM